jgi:acetolactate synthase I/II/III large subunit
MDDWTGGRAVVELLKAEGVRHIFGIVGSTFLDVLDRLYDDSSVEYINVRHEQAAAFMADGLARVTDRPGVCLVTSGPGATNLLTGVAAAHVAHSPVVVLVGGIALDHYQKDAFQEYDLISMFRPVTKQAIQINKAERIPELVRGALRAAMSGRPGPVFVEIPRDVLSRTVPAAAALAPDRYRVTHAQPPHADAVQEAARRLRRAERPLLLVGGGASRAGAGELVVELSDRHGIPMITAYGRNDAVPNAHPFYLGPLGRAGAPEAAAACRRADVIVAVGSRLAQFTTQFDDRYIRPGTALIQIDLRRATSDATIPWPWASTPTRVRRVGPC